MPNIKPLSDLRNYTEVLKEASAREKGWISADQVEAELGL